MDRRSKVLECECGHVVTGDDEATFVTAVQRHARNLHRMSFSREQILWMARRNEGETKDFASVRVGRKESRRNAAPARSREGTHVKEGGAS